MYRCSRPSCAWRSFAPAAAAAREQYVEHLVDAHTEDVDVDVPEGMVQLRIDDEWLTVTPEEARRLHRERHVDSPDEE